MRIIDKIIVHCSATPEGRDYTVADIDKWHRARGWKCIGYHYVIYRDGTIHQGRKEEVVGSHCTGQNRRSIGICYIGGMTTDMKAPKDTRTDKQKNALRALLKQLRKKYPKAVIYGHRNFAKKSCPSFDAKTEYQDI